MLTPVPSACGLVTIALAMTIYHWHQNALFLMDRRYLEYWILYIRFVCHYMRFCSKLRTVHVKRSYTSHFRYTSAGVCLLQAAFAVRYRMFRLVSYTEA